MIKKIVECVFFPLYKGGDVMGWQRQVENHAATLKHKGVTHAASLLKDLS